MLLCNIPIMTSFLKPCREAVCTIFMMVFGMTRPGIKLTTYHARDGHANHVH